MNSNDGTLPGFFPATVMPDPDWWQTLWPDPRRIVALLGVQSGMDVVDLCCGDGLFTVPLALLARRCIAIDIDRGMLAATRQKLDAAGTANYDLIEGDAYDISERVRQLVHFVLIANTFHGVPEKQRLADAVATVLNPEGRFAIVNWHRRPREETTVLGLPRGPKTELRMTPVDTATVVRSAGFRQVGLIELPPYHYGAVFAKQSQ